MISPRLSSIVNRTSTTSKLARSRRILAWLFPQWTTVVRYDDGTLPVRPYLSRSFQHSSHPLQFFQFSLRPSNRLALRRAVFGPKAIDPLWPLADLTLNDLFSAHIGILHESSLRLH